MRYFGLIFLIYFLFTCCGAKKTVPNKTTKINEHIYFEKDSTNISQRNLDISIPKKIDTTINHIISCEFTLPIKGSIRKPHHNDFNKLLEQFVSDSGLVDYNNFRKRQLDLQNYISYLGKNRPTDDWVTEDKLAYWINTYNALTIDLILRNYPLKTIKDIEKPWKQRLWKLGDKWYNLDEIEHLILRKMNDPRIHFAIVCASISCPKLQNEAFTASKLDKQLTKAAKEFLTDSERNSISENNLELSKIFQWFSKDFKQEGSLIDFINKYSDINVSAKAKKTFKTYNWDLNE